MKMILSILLCILLVESMKVNLNNVYTVNGDAKYIIGSSYIRRKNKTYIKKVIYSLEQNQIKHRQLDAQIIEYEKKQYIDEYELKSLKSQKLQLKDKIIKLENETKNIIKNDDDNNAVSNFDELGKGGYSKVLMAKCVKTSENKAIKVADLNDCQLLFKEYLVLSRLSTYKGFTKVNYFGKQELLNQQQHAIMVMDILGPSLEKLLFSSKLGVKGFSSLTILKIALQLLNRLSVLSSFNIVHNDIHPGNFLMGLKLDSDIVHLIDFGACGMSNIDTKNENIFRGAFSKNNNDNDNDNIGTLSFTSIGVSMRRKTHYEKNEKDDLESLSYSLAYLLMGKLPWDKFVEEVNSSDKQAENSILEKIISMKKEFILNEEKCDAAILINYILSHVKTLGDKDKPDYQKLIKLCDELIAQSIPSNFDWIDDKITWNDTNGKLIFETYSDHKI